jgi:hypothetical protein
VTKWLSSLWQMANNIAKCLRNNGKWLSHMRWGACGVDRLDWGTLAQSWCGANQLDQGGVGARGLQPTWARLGLACVVRLTHFLPGWLVRVMDQWAHHPR